MDREESPDEAISASLMDGRFRVERVVGQGAFGRVYLAFDTRLRRNVAIKELLAARSAGSAAAYERYLDRFEREARAGAIMQHPNIVAVHELAIDHDQNYYLIMEYIDGTDLRGLLAQVQTLTIERAVTIAIEIARALEAVHEQDIVHRDLKPANIMLTRRGVAKLADFGVAQVGSESNRTQFIASHPGTPLYMSPEQASGSDYLDGRSDLYSLGLILYEMLVGQPYARRRQPLTEARPDCSPHLVAIVNRLMMRAPDERYQHAGDVVQALMNLSSAPAIIPPADSPSDILSPAVPSAYPGIASGSASEHPRSASGIPPAFGAMPYPATGKGRRGLIVGIAGAAVAIVAIMAVIVLATRGGGTPAQTATPVNVAIASTTVIAASPTPASSASQPTILPATATAIIPTALSAVSPTTILPTAISTATPAPPTSTPRTPPTGAYVADFSMWELADNPGNYRTSFDRGTGEYHETLLHDSLLQRFLAPGVPVVADFTLEADVRQVAGSDAGQYGLTFRVQPAVPGQSLRPGYMFFIDSQGHYGLSRSNTDGSITMVQTLIAAPPGLLKTGLNAVNHLTVTCRGDQITLAINGMTLGSYQATINQAGAFGVGMRDAPGVSGAEVAFANLWLVHS